MLEGLAAHAPGILEPLAALGPELWPIVEQLPTVGRVALRRRTSACARPSDPVLSGWHAVNCLREWRGDTHWALVVAAGLTGVEASILHNAWLGYEPGLAAALRVAAATRRSRPAGPPSRPRAWPQAARSPPTGIALRQRIEDDTDRLTTLPWELLGADAARSVRRGASSRPASCCCDAVDETAGPNYQPASRIRPPRDLTAASPGLPQASAG